MLPVTEGFEVSHNGVAVRCGPGAVAGMGELIASNGGRRAMIVCGANVAKNDDVIGPLREGLGDLFVGVFDGTTPQKSISSVYAGIDRMRELDADVLVGVGGGSSLDIARQISAFAADGRSVEEVRDAAAAGTLTPPTPQPGAAAAVIVPTTLAGADLSPAGSIEVLSPEETESGQPVRTEGVTVPLGVYFDVSLFAHTPRSAMIGSTMNGFNKGVETLYSPRATALSDALASHGVRLMSAGIRAFGDDYAHGLQTAVSGLVLSQMERRVSIIHAVARGVSRFTEVQQGVAHAILAPHVVRYVLSVADARRRLLASAFGVDDTGTDADVADRVVAALTEVRDSIGVPGRLSEVIDVGSFNLDAAASYVQDQPLMAGAPLERPATLEELRGIFEAAF